MGAIVEIGFSAVAVERGLNSLSARLQSFAAGLKNKLPDLAGLMGFGGGLGGAAAGLTGAAVAIKGILGRFDDLADAALKLGESTETLQRVQHVAELSGSSLDGVTASMLRLEKAMGEADNEAAAKALGNLGLTSEKLMAMPLDEKLATMADAFQKARSTGTGYNDILALLGKSAGDLIPLFQQSGESLREAFGDAPVVLDDSVQRMAVLNDAVDDYIMRLKSMGGELVGQFMIGSAAAWNPYDMEAMNKAVELSSYLKGIIEQQDREKKSASIAEQQQIQRSQENAKKLKGFQEDLLDYETRRLDPATRLAALMDQQQKKIDAMRAAGGAMYAATIEGMKQFTAAQVASGGVGAEGLVTSMKEVLKLQEQIVQLQSQLRDAGADHAAEVAAAEAKAKAAETEAWWQQMITEEKERQDQFNATQDLAMEVSLLRAKAMGQSSLVTALEREQEIRQRTQEIMSRTGMGADQARSVATSMVDMQARADQRAQRDQGQGMPASAEADKPGRIRGYSFARQGGAYERQDHLYGAGAKFRDNQTNLLRDQAANNGREKSTPSQDTSTAQTALQTIQQILTTLQGGA